MERGSLGKQVFPGVRSQYKCYLLLFFSLNLLFITCCANATPPPLIITHKLPELNSSVRVLHEVKVLQLALDKTVAEFGPYELHGIPPMNRARTLAALNHNIYPNLVLLMSYEDELAEQEQLDFIPFPLDRGALSYRICFMRDAIKPEISKITSVEQLKNYQFGVGIGWADGKILRHNGLKVIEAATVVSLFRMTKAGRVDLFCRGPMEFLYEQQDPKSLGLTSEASFALYYPLPKFFFAHKDNQAALKRIKKGLEIAYLDGSFDALWRKSHLQALEHAQLKRRQIIKLKSPLIEHLPNAYETYLYDPLAQ